MKNQEHFKNDNLFENQANLKMDNEKIDVWKITSGKQKIFNIA